MLYEICACMCMCIYTHIYHALQGRDAADPLREAFCACMCLLEQLWVRHSATYMMFNR